ncbi:LrgB family protein [Clostridium sp. NSJ-6]|uniref:LrgB family protein n=1 Tax=Clostridium hominis TaxID=2763036 RepID=A0ABR7D7C5_9CLOT|nr:LrgB family protein [Clostridium hominis]MBC5627280.1 LrgB family protein [Clostridium hominis]
MDIFTNNIFFGLFVSLIAFEVGLIIYRKTKLPLFNPLLIAIIIVVGFLKLFNIDFDTYNESGKFINMFLGPATIVLAVPLYKQFELLKKNFLPILLGITIGSLVGILSIISISVFLKLDNLITISLLSKSVTTPIGIEITNQLGGLAPVTVLAIILSGIVGAIVAPPVCKVFKITNPVAIGVGIGTSSHAVGTSKAFEMGETEGAMSSLSIGIAGVITVFLAPLCYNLLANFIK